MIQWWSFVQVHAGPQLFTIQSSSDRKVMHSVVGFSGIFYVHETGQALGDWTVLG